MSCYYETKENLDFEKVKQDVRNNQIKGISENKNDDTTEGSICLFDGKNYVWMSEGTINSEHLGLKRWGSSDEDNIIKILEEHYKVTFQDEDELGFLVVG